MAWTVDSSGTQTATIGTEHTLSTPTTAATYQLNVDCQNLANGDLVELRIYKQIDGTNSRQCWKGTFQNAQTTGTDSGNPGKFSPYVETAGNQLKFTLKQTAGTGRNFPWSLERV